jgi:WD40 repeat protein
MLWDVTTRMPLSESLLGAWGLAFSPDGQLLASTRTDGTIILWDISLESWLARAREIVKRNMTFEEWRTYMGDRPYRKIFDDLPEPMNAP